MKFEDYKNIIKEKLSNKIKYLPEDKYTIIEGFTHLRVNKNKEDDDSFIATIPMVTVVGENSKLVFSFAFKSLF